MYVMCMHTLLFRADIPRMSHIAVDGPSIYDVIVLPILMRVEVAPWIPLLVPYRSCSI